MTIEFNPVFLEEARQSLHLTDMRAVEHLWHALQAFDAAGINVEKGVAVTDAAITSTDMTVRMLQEKYGKK